MQNNLHRALCREQSRAAKKKLKDFPSCRRRLEHFQRFFQFYNMTIHNVEKVVQSVPEWYQKPCMMGIGTNFDIVSVCAFSSPHLPYTLRTDEAGRGPVLGPMCYGCAFCPLEYKDDLKKQQFADSKALTAEKRDQLYDSLDKSDFIDCFIDEISATEISNAMLQAHQQTNLNQIAVESTVKIINKALQLGVDLREVYVDTLGDPAKHKERLSQKFPGIQFTVCPKADAIYPIVSAASIAAKVWRDRALEALHGTVEGGKKSQGLCSGYPGDAETKAWLKNHVTPVFGFPSLVRFSWATCKTILDSSDCIKVEWECEQDDAASDQRSLQSMMGDRGEGAAAASLKHRHSYFRARKLQKVVSGGWY